MKLSDLNRGDFFELYCTEKSAKHYGIYLGFSHALSILMKDERNQLHPQMQQALKEAKPHFNCVLDGYVRFIPYGTEVRRVCVREC